MRGRIPETTLTEIRDRANIVEIVGAHVGLKRVGRNQVGLCPFHAEKSPSFTVNDERGIFHCFGCGAGGNVFTFLMKMENATFPRSSSVWRAATASRSRSAARTIRRSAGAKRSFV